MDKQVINLTLFLIKDHVQDLKDCLKSSDSLSSSKLKPQFGLDGEIYYCDSNKKYPRWKPYLDELSNEAINISENASNKAIVLIHIQDRIIAIVFGYGRSFLKEEFIERNFGLNVTNDIMKGLTGEPYDPAYGNHISGKDSLVVSIFMEMTELKEKLRLYYAAYKDERYKRIGFEWVDNVAEIRDSVQSEALDFELANAIENRQIDHLHIAPPETTDWDRIIGFCYSGIGKKMDDSESYNLDLYLTEYVEKIKPGINVYQKIRRDKLYAMNSDGVPFAICSIYAALVFQTEYEGKNYILCSGTWYSVETSFFEQVNNFIKTRVPRSSVTLPDCPSDKDEGAYNEMVAESNADFCLMDKKLISVENGPKQIEACDIFTRDKKMIHVKNKGQSAQLSHLFSQGKVSAECFVSDVIFRKQVSDITACKFDAEVFDYTQKPQSNEFEIVYAIIDTKDSPIETKLPFFSKVNLMITAQELDRIHFKFSVCFVRKV